MMKKLVKRHAVMMEYVLIAVLIAAAVVVAVIMFGRSVSSEMNVATTAMTSPKEAETAQSELKKANEANTKKAQEHTKKMHNYDD